MHSRLLALAIITGSMVAGALPAHAFYLSVSPPRFELKIGRRPVTKSIKIGNHANKPAHIRVRVANWDLDENNKVREVAPTPQSLDQWLIINPLKFTIPPGKTRTVRFAVRPYVRPKGGEHRAVIYFEDNGPAKQIRKGIFVRFKLGVVVYGYVGAPIRRGKLLGVQARAGSIDFSIISVGNANVRMHGRYGLWPNADFPGARAARARLASVNWKSTKPKSIKGAVAVGRLPSKPVLPGKKRTVKLLAGRALKPGAYKLVVAGRLGAQDISKVHDLLIAK